MRKALGCIAIIAIIFHVNAKPVETSSSWWDNSIMYQVCPRSFKDSNSDGIGDLKGITNKLKYISEFADIVWISPFFSSPLRDFGYDITNYTGIHPDYGTFEDFEKLEKKAKSLGLKILLDFVPNHTSDKHEWFQKSIKRIKPYEDYYVWKDAKIMPNGTEIPPNNWISQFTGSAWTWNEEREQYYYHEFDKSQPDLNFNNPDVRKEMEDIIRFWLDRGIDGFRIDAVVQLFEDHLFRDEPRSGANVPPDDPYYLEHIYTKDMKETYDMVNSWRLFMDEYSKTHGTSKKFIFLEVGTDNFTKRMEYYNYDADPMNFGFVHYLTNDSTVNDFRDNINAWLNSMPQGKVANWAVGNHDKPRVASRFGYNGNRADEISILSAILPGMMILYNGDEIGMTNRFFTYKETIDPEGCNAGPERYQQKSRDPQRTPFQWDDTVSAGFSTNTKTWLPVNDNYKTLNLAAQKNSKHSHYTIIKTLAKLKKTPTLRKGSCDVISIDDKVLHVSRKLSTQEPISLLINFIDEDVVIDGDKWLSDHSEILTIYVASMKSGFKGGETVRRNKILLPPRASIILGL